jgi:hypothetical protein
MFMTFGTWNAKGPYRAGSLITAARDIAIYRLHLVRAQEIRWDRCDTKPAGNNRFFYGSV